MRTDGVQIVPEAVAAIRGEVEGDARQALPAAVRARVQDQGQERPGGPRGDPPDRSRRTVPSTSSATSTATRPGLYELIWKRTLASQMASAEVEQTTAEIEVQGRDGKLYGLRATGSVIQFDGFLKLYEEGRDDRVRIVEKGKDDPAEDDEASRRLPPLAQGDMLSDKGIDANQHFTQPPPRYSEATLVKRMEELGIGRPSTYASTLGVLRDREYVRMDKKRLVPEDKGRLVIAFLESFFKRYVEYDFTASLEDQLDLISDGKLEWKHVLRDFWRNFTIAVDRDQGPARRRGAGSAERDARTRTFSRQGAKAAPTAASAPNAASAACPSSCRRRRGPSSAAPTIPSADLRASSPRPTTTAEAELDGKVLGQDPQTGLAVTLRTGRFGPYLQLGEPKDYDDEKPKRSSIPKGIDAATIDLERALQLLRLPRELGLHPESGKMITAGLGRYGPFILHDGTYANLENIEEVFSVGINRAVTLLAEKKAGKGGRFGRAAQRQVLKDLGEHPECRRQDRGDERPLWPLRQPQQGLCHDSQSQGPRRGVGGRSGRAPQPAHREAGRDRRQGQEPARKAPAKKPPAKKAGRKQPADQDAAE